MYKYKLNIAAGLLVAGMLVSSGGVQAKEQAISDSSQSGLRQTYASASVTPVFTDIKGHWAEATIKQAVADGYLKGYANGTFKPNGLITRAELASVLVRITNNKNDGNKVSFTDVPSSYWAASAINSAVGAGFIKAGDATGGKFNPNQAMTRYDMAKWFTQGLVRSEESFATALKEVEGTLLPFTETYKVGISKTQVPYIAIARGTGLMKGKPDDSFGLNDTTTRAEVAVMIYRYLKIEGSKAESYKGLNELREVGVYGTNAISLGKATGGISLSKKPATIYDVMGKDLALKYNRGTMVMNRFIVVDNLQPLGSEDRSIFADMFTRVQGTSFSIYTEVTVTAKVEFADPTSYSNSFDWIGGSRIHSKEDLFDLYGYTTVPNRFGPLQKHQTFADFLPIGEPVRFWQKSSYPDGAIDIKAADGTWGIIRLNR
ncbi:S-layer homology domain-containing protein [Paenibacillus sp. FSL H8-0537]|uniref:S-layer homology domain-containing protein n=1 Tax=Paenibacillus sp. FSL H8-0537 TaxID=2921399 RepID=UPI00310141EA